MGSLQRGCAIDARIEISGTDLDEFTNLAQWLRGERALTGRVRTVATPPGPNDLGPVADVLMVALGSGGAVAALSGSLTAWLRSRRSDLTIKITSDSGTVEVSAARLKDADVLPLVESVLRGKGE